MRLLWHRRGRRQRRKIFQEDTEGLEGAKVDKVEQFVDGGGIREVADVDDASCRVCGCGESGGSLSGRDVEVEEGRRWGWKF